MAARSGSVRVEGSVTPDIAMFYPESWRRRASVERVEEADYFAILLPVLAIRHLPWFS